MSNNFTLKERGAAHLLAPVAALAAFLIVGAVMAANIKISKEFPSASSDVKGVLIAHGDDDSGSGSSGSGSSGSGSSDSKSSEDDDSSGSSSSGNDTVKTESKTPQSETRIKTESSPSKQKTEVRFSEEEKIKTRVEDGRTRIDVYSGGVKVRYEIKDGRVIVKAETEEGEDVPEQELFKIEDRLDKSGIKVATEGGKLFVTRNSVGALANFPLQVDLNTNQLIASTSAGQKVLTTLPDQAVANMLAANIISKVNTQELVNQAKLGSLTSVSDIIALSERSGQVVYEINGLREQKLLGFIPITVSTKVFVSAETGQMVAQEQSLVASIVDLLSP